jgi:hypothetical protein
MQVKINKVKQNNKTKKRMSVRKTPLTEVFHFFPGNGARKGLDGWRVVDY